jgi:hypothetical protein
MPKSSFFQPLPVFRNSNALPSASCFLLRWQLYIVFCHPFLGPLALALQGQRAVLSALQKEATHMASAHSVALVPKPLHSDPVHLAITVVKPCPLHGLEGCHGLLQDVERDHCKRTATP